MFIDKKSHSERLALAWFPPLSMPLTWDILVACQEHLSVVPQ